MRVICLLQFLSDFFPQPSQSWLLLQPLPGKHLRKHTLGTAADYCIVFLRDINIPHDCLTKTLCIFALPCYKFIFHFLGSLKNFLTDFKPIQINSAFGCQVKIHTSIILTNTFKFILRIQNQDIIICPQKCLGNFRQLDKEGLPGS